MEAMENELNEVGIGEFLIGDRGTLITCNLGSCVGLSLFARSRRIGALLHIKLPEDQKFGNKEITMEFQPPRRERLTAYADSAVPIVLYEFERHGVAIGALEAKMAGGAKMFPVKDVSLDIGRNNVEVTKRLMARYGIKLVAADTGGTYGRTMSLNLATGAVRIVCANLAGTCIDF